MDLKDLYILERIVKKDHERLGHVWCKGDVYEWTKPTAYMKECYCGVTEQSTKAEWNELPIRDWPDPTRDRY